MPVLPESAQSTPLASRLMTALQAGICSARAAEYRLSCQQTMFQAGPSKHMLSCSFDFNV